MSKIDNHFMRQVLKSARPEQDEEIWRTTEEGKHFKFETETGEIKAGFGGRLNGQKLKPKGSAPQQSTPKQETTAPRGKLGARAGKSYYKPLPEMDDLPSGVREATDKRFSELDKTYHATVSKVEPMLKRDQEIYDTMFKNRVAYELETHPGMDERTAKERTLALLGKRPDYKSSMRYLETGGEFDCVEYNIALNPHAMGATLTFEDAIEKRRKHIEINKRRAEEGKAPLLSGNVGCGMEYIMIHEYAHAMDEEYNIYGNEKFREFYKSLSSDDIASVSTYALTNPQEFIAEAFAESFMGDTQGEVSKRFMKVLEEILNDD